MFVSSAPIRSRDRSASARVLRPIELAVPANDDGDDPMGDRFLDAALHHFAAHGLGAARAACGEAEAHWNRGERESAANWLAICRAFDKRLASDLEARLTGESSTSA